MLDKARQIFSAQVVNTRDVQSLGSVPSSSSAMMTKECAASMVPRSVVAWSDPTAAGRAVATKYSGNVLVYSYGEA